MNLDPEIAELLSALNDAFPRVETMAAPQLRAVIRERAQRLQRPEPVGEVTDRTVPGPTGGINVRIYWPTEPSGPLPIIVFAHGGGFVFCDLDSHDDLCRAMTNGVGAIVVSVDYRLAPEFPWPAAVNDVYAVADWTAEQAHDLGAGYYNTATAMVWYWDQLVLDQLVTGINMCRTVRTAAIPPRHRCRPG